MNKRYDSIVEHMPLESMIHHPKSHLDLCSHATKERKTSGLPACFLWCEECTDWVIPPVPNSEVRYE